MYRPTDISLFLRSPKLPVLVMEPGVILAAASRKGLASVLSAVVERRGASSRVLLVDGNGMGFTFDPETRMLLPSFPPRHVWTKRQIVGAYNAMCSDASRRYDYSLANRRLPRVVADIATLLLRDRRASHRESSGANEGAACPEP